MKRLAVCAFALAMVVVGLAPTANAAGNPMTLVGAPVEVSSPICAVPPAGHETDGNAPAPGSWVTIEGMLTLDA